MEVVRQVLSGRNTYLSYRVRVPARLDEVPDTYIDINIDGTYVVAAFATGSLRLNEPGAHGFDAKRPRGVLVGPVRMRDAPLENVPFDDMVRRVGGTICVTVSRDADGERRSDAQSRMSACLQRHGPRSDEGDGSARYDARLLYAASSVSGGDGSRLVYSAVHQIRLEQAPGRAGIVGWHPDGEGLIGRGRDQLDAARFGIIDVGVDAFTWGMRADAGFRRRAVGLDGGVLVDYLADRGLAYSVRGGMVVCSVRFTCPLFGGPVEQGAADPLTWIGMRLRQAANDVMRQLAHRFA